MKRHHLNFDKAKKYDFKLKLSVILKLNLKRLKL